MELRFIPPESPFRATRAGAGIGTGELCSHGAPLLALQFFNNENEKEDSTAVVLPACVAPQLFGAAIGLIGASGGVEAAESFVREMLTAANKTVSTVAAREAEQAEAATHCCEASYRTGGREHTCRSTTDSPS
ncbi:hypothetical protein B0675_02090 [Streptomyces sp. M41(2017)]|uniref:hypothetical protein n=1 Tax=Streptomyces sp. M41(2017) TaxID=1955065 RepID=UPI0009BD4C74|nr:hypothetical protein [Streptomyces sp. M41(2017)]OQQ16099.1 hypothetical protein B0675_02090 [Streptomyces sp. M41(2017)]